VQADVVQVELVQGEVVGTEAVQAETLQTEEVQAETVQAEAVTVQSEAEVVQVGVVSCTDFLAKALDTKHRPTVLSYRKPSAPRNVSVFCNGNTMFIKYEPPKEEGCQSELSYVIEVLDYKDQQRVVGRAYTKTTEHAINMRELQHTGCFVSVYAKNEVGPSVPSYSKVGSAVDLQRFSNSLEIAINFEYFDEDAAIYGMH
jgi:hypothetical protein